MKKTFTLTDTNKSLDRQVESIKHEIKKYISRERKKSIPEGIDFWDFDCRFGSSTEDASTIHISEINSMISNFASEDKESFYIEILAKPGKRSKK